MLGGRASRRIGTFAGRMGHLMTRLLIVVEKESDWGSYYPSDNVVTAGDYLRDTSIHDERTQVINLCRSYRYLGSGYYVSLLAEARGHRVLPSVRTINDLRGRALYALDIQDLNQKLGRFLPAGGEDITDLSILVYFGQTSHPSLADLARQVFELFPCPLLQIEFHRDRSWRIGRIKPMGLDSLVDDQEDAFAQALDHYSRKIWRTPRRRRQFRFDLAMLCDADEEMPPSDRMALKHFVAAGRELGIDVDTIGRGDFQRLAEYDGLFIRTTTAIDHFTYRFAHRAEKEGLVVIDDPLSILRCTNKIYLHDLLRAHRVAVPRGEIVHHRDEQQLESLPERLGLPLVLKIPDGSFSRGVIKVESMDELRRGASELFQRSELLIAQEYLYTEYDWRIGVLNNRALYACRYFMSRGHWQIYNHAAGGAQRSGDFECVDLADTPPKVLKLALRATRLIGNGLYGVDIKQSGKTCVVIEVNDNPSIDAGVEDGKLGKQLYLDIMAEFLRRMAARGLAMH